MIQEYATPTAASPAAHKPAAPKPAAAPGLPLFLQRQPATMFSGPTPAPYPSKGYLMPKQQPGTQFDTL